MESITSKPKVPKGPVGMTSYELLRTPSGSPYIPLKTASITPVFLTTFYITDIEVVHATLSHSMLAANLISVPQPYTIKDAEYWIKLQLEGKCSLPLQVIRISDPESGLLIGSTSLLPLESEPLAFKRDKLPQIKGRGQLNEYELGYYLHPEWQGKGIMCAAAKALIEWGTREYDANVIIRVAEDNTASRNVVNRLQKFVREESRDGWVDWPEVKGGGKKRLMFWKWMP